MNIKIATILTVYNRKQKTLSCLQHLFEAMESYNQLATEPITTTVFLTDDGCTDGTADAVRDTFSNRDIHIIKGTGKLFWAGGMRLAWQTAIDSGTTWDYYLLLNDDTYVWTNVFSELFEADNHGFCQAGCHGLSSGITCQPGNKDDISYGGLNFVNWTKGRQVLLHPTKTPQRIDLTHANILLVHHTVVDKIGIFHKSYTHGCADNDYSMTAHRHAIPVFSTSNVCGECAYDHHSQQEEAQMLTTLSLSERKKYVNSPKHSDHDYLLFVRRNIPIRLPFAIIMRTIRIYFPKLYYCITNLRGVYK